MNLISITNFQMASNQVYGIIVDESEFKWARANVATEYANAAHPSPVLSSSYCPNVKQFSHPKQCLFFVFVIAIVFMQWILPRTNKKKNQFFFINDKKIEGYPMSIKPLTVTHMSSA